MVKEIGRMDAGGLVWRDSSSELSPQHILAVAWLAALVDVLKFWLGWAKPLA